MKKDSTGVLSKVSKWFERILSTSPTPRYTESPLEIFPAKERLPSSCFAVTALAFLKPFLSIIKGNSIPVDGSSSVISSPKYFL